MNVLSCNLSLLWKSLPMASEASKGLDNILFLYKSIADHYFAYGWVIDINTNVEV